MSKLKCLLQPIAQPNCTSSALLILRLITGAAFILHGWGKIQAPFSWMGPESNIPAIFQFFAALSEFGGGIALIIGLLTRIATLGIAATMVVAVHLHMMIMGDPFVNMTGGSSYELALVYLGIALLLNITGPGNFSLDAKLFGNRDCKTCCN